MKLLFGPYIKENPYQKQLTDNLKSLGIQVKDIQETFFKQSLSGSWKPDVLHLHWLHVFFLADNYFLAIIRLAIFMIKIAILKLIDVKIIWTVHNINNHERQFYLLDRLCTQFVTYMADAIIVHSQAALDKLIKKININNKQKISIIPHGNYLEYYQNNVNRETARTQLGLTNSNFVLLFIGAIRPYKGIIELIEKFQQISHNNLYLIIAGNPISQKFSQLIESKIQGDRAIKFIPGYIPDSQVQVYLNACDAVVFPYQDILTSGSVLLAMSFEKPCIVPRLGCIKEVLDEQGAFLYDPDNKDGLSQALINVIKQKDRLSEMGKHNLELASKYNWQEIAKTTFNIYQSSLK